MKADGNRSFLLGKNEINIDTSGSPEKHAHHPAPLFSPDEESSTVQQQRAQSRQETSSTGRNSLQAQRNAQQNLSINIQVGENQSYVGN